MFKEISTPRYAVFCDQCGKEITGGAENSFTHHWERGEVAQTKYRFIAHFHTYTEREEWIEAHRAR